MMDVVAGTEQRVAGTEQGIVHGIEHANDVDAKGRPGEGFAKGIGFNIDWQDMPLLTEQDEQTGALMEDVMMALLTRLKFCRDVESESEDYRIATVKVQEALFHLVYRSKKLSEYKNGQAAGGPTE